jgi:hypothetical protein
MAITGAKAQTEGLRFLLYNTILYQQEGYWSKKLLHTRRKLFL